MANIKRLTELLENVVPFIPGRQFDMRHWTRGKELPNGCGTSACVAGWAGVHPPFNDEGYGLPQSVNSGNDERPPEFLAARGSHAIQEFFELDGAELDHIFLSIYKSPVEAACRIIDVIEANS